MTSLRASAAIESAVHFGLAYDLLIRAGWETEGVVADADPDRGNFSPYLSTPWFDAIWRTAALEGKRPDAAFTRIMLAWLKLLRARPDLLPTLPALFDLGGSAAVYHLLDLEARKLKARITPSP